MVRDEALEAKVARVSRPVLRKLLIGTIPCLCAVLVYFSVVEPGLPRVFFAVFAGVITWNCLKRLQLERSIVQNHGESVGTVLEHRRLGIKRGSIIDYAFLSADNRTNVGKVKGSTALPKEGQTFVVVYNLREPSLSLPLFSFWFYEFDFEFPKTSATSAS